MKGRVAVRYTVLAGEMEDRFYNIKDKVSKINKIMLSLKAKQRLWFPDHSGSTKPVEVILHNFPLIQGGYTDIVKNSKQSPSSAHVTNKPKKHLNSVEQWKEEQRLERLEKRKREDSNDDFIR